MANVSYYKNVSKKLVRAIYKFIRYQAKGITRLPFALCATMLCDL